MMTLVIGGSGSGKSSYAEQCAVSLSQSEKETYYLATMQVFDNDAEGRKKVERHRQLRKDKGFITIEQPTDIHRALEKMKHRQTALLECVSNLTANEMFSGKAPKAAQQVSEKIIEDIRQLNQGVTHLVVVSSNVFEDGIVYDETTMAYIRAMGIINRELAFMADAVVEVVVGIPLVLKT